MKKVFAAALAVGFAVGMSATAYAGQWVFDGPESWQYRYVEDDGSSVVSNWKQVDGKWYHFDENGYMDVGFRQILDPADGEEYWYYFGEDGAMATSGSWEGAYIGADGKLNFDEGPTGSWNGQFLYYRYIADGAPVPAEPRYTGENAGDLERTYAYECAIPWKRALLAEFTGHLSEHPFGENFEAFSMDFQLPENWFAECPTPVMTATLNYSCFDYWGGVDFADWNMAWQVDANNVIHITANQKQFLNFDRATGIATYGDGTTRQYQTY